MFSAFRHRVNSVFRSRLFLGTAFIATAGTTTALYIHYYTPIPGFHRHHLLAAQEIPKESVPKRNDQLQKLKSGKLFDVLVIGGGATGAGVALDAATRGLSVALVERDDFASGTSSRSTKLIHGGVRYLEKAFLKFDKGQFDLVTDALRERKHLIQIAPHLSSALPIIVPIYNSFPSALFWIPYYYAGVKAYDFVAGFDGLLEPSYWMSYQECRQRFPMLKKEGLKGGVVYFDGQHNDSRMNIGIVLTAAARGATTTNHVEVVSLIENEDKSRIIGCHMRDLLTGEEFDVHAKQVVNATGPFCDSIRQMADPLNYKQMIAPSSGVHVILSDKYCPKDMGLIVPKTTDGRVLFLLPWEGSTIVGTTDSSTEITALPRPHESEIQFILKEASHFLNAEIKREDVDAAWSGIRPLAKDPNAKDLASTSRDHVIEITKPGLITISGGKWTTYRKMAEDTVDRLLEHDKALASNNPELAINTDKIKECHTIGVPIIGAAGWSLQVPRQLERLGLPADVAAHLSHNYGDKAFEVARIVSEESESLCNKLAEGYPFIEAEVLYGIRHEYAQTAVDVIANRIRLSFLNSDAAIAALPRVINLMSKELNWSIQRKMIEYQKGVEFIKTMNRTGRKKVLSINDRSHRATVEKRFRTLFDHEQYPTKEVETLRSAFESVDVDKDSLINKLEVMKLIESTNAFGLKTSIRNDERALNKLLTQLDLHCSGKKTSTGCEEERADLIGFEEFLFSAAATQQWLKHSKN